MESGCVEMVNREVENNELENMDSGTISTVSALQALSNLLYSEDQKEDFYSEQTLCSTSSGSINPGNIGTHLTENVKVFSANSDDTAENIWNTEEIPEKAEFDDQWDGRELPEYEFVFKQQVRTEDLFLGLTRKDSSTACCENLVVCLSLFLYSYS